jgi:soluble lytic murein transglycosylase-like protein
MKKFFKRILFSLLMTNAIIASQAQENWSTQVLQSSVDEASNTFGVPSNILYAIMSVESGIWPWTINARGRSHYFMSKQDAIDFALDHAKNGNHNMNVGLMQIHWSTHRGVVQDISKGFDPGYNINYAAKLLKDLKNEFGTWEKAVKAYHSRITKYANIYGKKISKELGFPLEYLQS